MSDITGGMLPQIEELAAGVSATEQASFPREDLPRDVDQLLQGTTPETPAVEVAELEDPMTQAAHLAISSFLEVNGPGRARLPRLLDAAFGVPFVEKDVLHGFIGALKANGAQPLGKGIFVVSGTSSDEATEPRKSSGGHHSERRQPTVEPEAPAFDIDGLLEATAMQLNGRPHVTDATLLGTARALHGDRIPQHLVSAFFARAAVHSYLHPLPNGSYHVAIPRDVLKTRTLDPQASFGYAAEKTHDSFDKMIRASGVQKGPKRKPHNRKNGGISKKSARMEGMGFPLNEEE